MVYEYIFEMAENGTMKGPFGGLLLLWSGRSKWTTDTKISVSGCGGTRGLLLASSALMSVGLLALWIYEGGADIVVVPMESGGCHEEADAGG
jgi:hypothetical protein